METGTRKLNILSDTLSLKIQDNHEMSTIVRFMVRIKVRVIGMKINSYSVYGRATGSGEFDLDLFITQVVVRKKIMTLISKNPQIPHGSETSRI